MEPTPMKSPPPPNGAGGHQTAAGPPPSPSQAAATSSVPNLDKLRLSQSFHEQLGVRKAIVTIPVRKPDRQWFVRTHPEEAWSLQTATLELKEERETYLVDPSLWGEVSGEVVPKLLVMAVNRQGVPFLWPIRLPSTDGRLDDWNRSALEAATRARTRWVRIAANMSAGSYDVFETGGDFGEPQWPEIDFHAVITIAFKDRYIAAMDHPVLRRLRGEV